jgi:ribA/ribD-fused uncharacterized protein
MIDSFKGKYRFLSNFYPCLVEYQGNVYESVEHAYSAAKTLDVSFQEAIFFARTAAEAKKIGRRVPLREDWEDIKVDIMKNLLVDKFSTFELKGKLLATGEEELVEGNWWGDTFWGVCNGIGQNCLGKLLMEVREEIRGDLGSR